MMAAVIVRVGGRSSRHRHAGVAGTATRDNVVDCVESAVVQLTRDGKMVAETTTDNYGDFKFDRLPPESGAYVVRITAPRHDQKTVEVTLGDSVNLGEIGL